MMIRWRALIEQFPERWQILDIPVARVTNIYRKLYDASLPRCFLPQRTAFTVRNVPYSYPSVKRKCYKACQPLRNGLVEGTCAACKTCSKIRHSCMRNICSFRKLSGRRIYRIVGRSLDFLTRKHRPSFDLPDICIAADEIEARMERQHRRFHEQHQPVSCISCGCCMQRPSVRVSDAGQAYECIDRTHVNSSLQSL